LAFAACSPEGVTASGKPDTDGKVVDGKSDAWNETNNPERFRLQFIYKYDELIAYEVGRAEQTPWPSDYWSYYQDSINVRFHGADQLSPTEKYDVAFHEWEADQTLSPVNLREDCGEDGTVEDTHDAYYDHLGPAAQWQHRNKGNWKSRNGIDDDGDGQTDECTKDDEGNLDYDGIETWWGLCHAWAPAAILEPEPLQTVTFNSVEFTVSDIKALLIAQYDRNSALMLGGRCNERELERDEHGRVTLDQCRDTNAGAFFVVATNMLGKDKRSFAEDRTAGYQVWNQPVLGYRILEQLDLSEEEALTRLGRTLEDGQYTELFDSPEAVAWRYVKMEVDYITESSNTTEGALTPNIANWTRTDHYEMVVELDAEGMVVGGEWLGYSRETHPDFLWLPTRAVAGNPRINTGTVRQLLDLARDEENPFPDVTCTEFGGDTAVAIPDNDPQGASHAIDVTDELNVGSLSVKLDIEHTYISDLRLTLNKEETEVVLHDRAGGGADRINETYVVREFDDTSAKGVWTLKMTDLAGQDVGQLANLTLTVCSNRNRSTKEQTFTNETSAAIPDNDEQGLTSVITVEEEGTVKSLQIDVDITHTHIGDLKLELVHGGSRQVLHSREGGGADNLQKSFTIGTFNGAPIAGEWLLVITDGAGQDVGTLNSWSITARL
jgi:subtilisin-like proprotein convertase family protein